MKANIFKKQLEEMKYIQRMFCLIQSEIRYSRAFLGEIFWKIGQNVREPYCYWMKDMSKRMNEFTGESFENIWTESIERNLKVLKLPLNEIEALKALGNQLGFADINVQMNLLDLYQNHLERAIREVREQVGTKVRLCHCLGVMSGLFITVLLF